VKPQRDRAVLLTAAAGLLMLAMLLLPPIRRASEASMSLHMLLQYPGLLVAGALLASALPPHRTRSLQRFNEHGLAGLLFVGLTMTVLMVPRVLDLALTVPWVEALKLLALLLCGGAIRLSWSPAGTVLQAFFLGNVLPMLVVVGSLYQEADSRLCNAYLLDDQRNLGAGLMWLTAGLLLWWLWAVVTSRRAVGPAVKSRM
jgi:hypothetical protein